MDWSSIDLDKEAVLSDSICNILGLDNSEDSDAQMGGDQPVVLEFCVALLVNILLHKDGTRKAEQIKDNILKALINLIESNIINLHSYVYICRCPLLRLWWHHQLDEPLTIIDFLQKQNNDSCEHRNQLNSTYLEEKLESNGGLRGS